MTNLTMNNYKRINISSKRQLTIPQAFFNALGFSNEAECILNDDELIIRPVHFNDSSYFSEQILKELIDEGFTGEELLAEFKKRQAKVKPAVNNMLEEAKAVAQDKAEYMTLKDVFEEK